MTVAAPASAPIANTNAPTSKAFFTDRSLLPLTLPHRFLPDQEVRRNFEDIDKRINGIVVGATGPAGPAGGALDGTYPNPGIASSVAGAGLTESSDVLAVGAGTGITVNANDVQIDSTVYRSGGTDVAVADGGTGASSASGARTNLDVPSNAEAVLDTLVDAKGDILTATAADTPARLAIGANGSGLQADSDETTGMKWVPHTEDFGLPGVLAPQGVGRTASGVSLVANRAYYCRFIAPRDMSITLVAFAVGTASGSDDACDVGIYSAAGARLVSAGATTGKLNGTGLKTVTISTTALTAGTVYYAAFSCGTIGSTAAALDTAALLPSSGAGDFFGTATGTRLIAVQSTAHPLPDPMTPSAAAGVPVLAVRES